MVIIIKSLSLLSFLFPIFLYLEKFLDLVGKPLCSVEILENADQKVLNIRTLFTHCFAFFFQLSVIMIS